MKKITMMLLLLAVMLFISIPAQACDWSTFGSQTSDNQDSYSGTPTTNYGNYTPYVGRWAACTSGSNNGQHVVATVSYYVRCTNTTSFSMNENVAAYLGLPVPPYPQSQLYYITSSGTVKSNQNNTQDTWELISDCDCYLTGTYSANGGFYNTYSC